MDARNLTIKLHKLKLTELALVLLFTLIALKTQINNAIINDIYYLFILGFAVLGIKKLNQGSIYLWLFVLVTAITGMISHLYNGNITIAELIIYILLFFCAISVIEYGSERVFLCSTMILSAIFLYSFIIHGLNKEIMIGTSNNFVSIYLISFVIFYYISCEATGSACKVYPAAIVWVLSILAVGRGGILATSFLLLGVLLYKNHTLLEKRNQINELRRRTMILGIIIIGMAIIVVGGVDKVGFLSRFAEKGMSNNGRFSIWYQYISSLSLVFKNILFGSDIENQIATWKFRGNMHNAFMQIHAFNGLVELLVIACILLLNIKKSLKNNQAIYLWCLMTVCLRGFTDRAFWSGSVGTLAFFGLLIYPFLKKQNPDRFGPKKSLDYEVNKI